jgi:hypothetical protein
VVVAGTAGAILFTEIVLTRLLSVLLYYHYSFLAVSIALFGLAWGALLAARRPLGDDSEAFARLAWRRLIGATAALLVVMLLLATVPPVGPDGWRALTIAVLAAVPLMMLGEVLARALALGRSRINRLYAVDLIASAAAALLAIPLLARVQGPAALAVAALAAALLASLLAPPRHRVWTAGMTAALGLAVLGAGLSASPLLQLTDPWFGRPVLERWNAYSRVRVRVPRPEKLELVIDRTASSTIPKVPPAPGGRPPAIDPLWAEQYADPSYALGRHPLRVAIIGVGGGPDLLSALAAGAREIVGFELNGRIVELLTGALSSHTAVALRPEVRLVRDEARHSLEGSEERYDVIRASLIDTWASTAAGGFVLSENGLYTVEAWRLFLRRLTPAGVLAVTRWHLPAAPAEAERLVALAAEAVDAEGLGPAGDRIIALALPSTVHDPMAGRLVQTITVLVSRTRFAPEEVARIAEFAAARQGALLLAPGRAPAPAAEPWPALLSARTRGDYIRASPWAIDPPRDSRPFFFLQLRPRDVLNVATYGPVSAITLNGVRVLVASALFALLGAGVLFWQITRLRRGPVGSSVRGDNLSRPGQVYFALLGLAYMMVQLALHQRLAIVLGHPTPTLALVIATMLLGTGLGSRAAAGARVGGAPNLVLLWPVAAVAALVALFPHLGELSSAPSLRWTAAGAGALSLAMGGALGVALPTGIRQLAASERRVAEAWAVNGAFSVAGASLGALAGLILGSHGLAALALPCYLAVFLIGWLESRPTSPGPQRSPVGKVPSSHTVIVLFLAVGLVAGTFMARGMVTIASHGTADEIDGDDKSLSPTWATTDQSS